MIREEATEKITKEAKKTVNAKIVVEANAANEESRAMNSQEEKIGKEAIKDAAVSVVKKIGEEATEETAAIGTVEKIVEARKAPKIWKELRKLSVLGKP